jgi:hypothetical protein
MTGNMGKYILLTNFKAACVSGQIQMLNITGWKTKALGQGGRGLNWFVVAEKNNLDYKILHKLCCIISFIPMHILRDIPHTICTSSLHWECKEIWFIGHKITLYIYKET